MSSASSTTSDSVPSTDNFFSITEEDTPQNSPNRAAQAANKNATLSLPNFQQNASSPASTSNGTRVRRLSNSSMASDTSFRLPSYDASPPYNLQSDLDASASEFEDSASTVGYGAQLDVISKEKLYDAYRKALDRYQKYRTRYTELVRRYRDLERDNNKARVSALQRSINQRSFCLQLQLFLHFSRCWSKRKTKLCVESTSCDNNAHSSSRQRHIWKERCVLRWTISNASLKH